MSLDGWRKPTYILSEFEKNGKVCTKVCRSDGIKDRYCELYELPPHIVRDAMLGTALDEDQIEIRDGR